MTQSSHRICILGGGFGGLYTALRLQELSWVKTHQPEIVLVDRHDRFVFLPLLYELITGELETWEIAPPYAELLANTNIRFQQAQVTAIQIEAQKVQIQDLLGNQSELTYDRLVLALGGETPLHLAPGVKDHAIPFRSLTDAYRLEEKLRGLENSPAEKIRVAIVGGGYSGVELACKLADRLGDRGRIRLVEQADQILRQAPDFNREAAIKALAEKAVWLDLETKVESVTAATIALDYKGTIDTIPVDLVLWTVGNQMHPVIANLPLEKNQRGQLVTSSHLQVTEHPEIFALGDLADGKDEEGRQVPATAQVAFQQADYAAWNIWASLSDRPLLPFRYQHLGEMLTLGENNATLSGLGIKLEGTIAHLVRRLAYLNRLPTLEHQLKVGCNWIMKPLYDLILANSQQ